MIKRSLFLALLLGTVTAAFSQTYTYYFTNNLTEASAGPALTEVLSCGASAGGFAPQMVTTVAGNCSSTPQTVFAFNEGGGLSFPNNNVIGGTYTIHMFFKFNQLSGYQRIIDFLDGSTDVGLYTLGNCLNFYPNGNVGACPYFIAGKFYLLSLVRDATTKDIAIYVNGASFGTYNDAADTYKPATATSPIVFFRDNIGSSAQCEDRDGSVKFLSLSPTLSTATQVAAVWANICSIALPVTLASFTGSKTNNGVVLNWQTQNEAKLSRYDVERSADGVRFATIGNVGVSNVPGGAYTYTHLQPAAINYYRLKMIDIGGGVQYSAVIKINLQNGSEVQVFPNPATNVVVVSGAAIHQPIQLFTAEGRLLKTVTADGGPTTISMAAHPAGIYIIQYRNGLQTERCKVMKY